MSWPEFKLGTPEYRAEALLSEPTCVVAWLDMKFLAFHGT
jgi:hypothetical protein